MSRKRVRHFRKFSGLKTNQAKSNWVKNPEKNRGISISILIGEPRKPGLCQDPHYNDTFSSCLPAENFSKEELSKVRAAGAITDTATQQTAFTISFRNNMNNRKTASYFIRKHQLRWNLVQYFGQDAATIKEYLQQSGQEDELEKIAFEGAKIFAPNENTADDLRAQIAQTCPESELVYVSLFGKNLTEELISKIKKLTWITGVVYVKNAMPANSSTDHRVGEKLKNMKVFKTKGKKPGKRKIYASNVAWYKNDGTYGISYKKDKG